MAQYIVTLNEGGPGEVRTFWSGDVTRPFRFTVGTPSEPVELSEEQAAALALRGTVVPLDKPQTKRPTKAAEED